MLNKSEKNILKFIKYAPIIFVMSTAFFITYAFIEATNKKLNNDIINLENEYFESQKEKVKTEVERVYEYILYEKKQSENNLKKELKNRVYEAHSIASNIYKENKNKSKKEILKLVQDALRDIRFNEGRGYYFMHTIEGANVLYPLNKKVEGKNYSQLKDINGYLLVQKIMKTIKNKTENFDTYYWSKPTNEGERIYKKIAFYKYFAPLNISIGTGEYLQDYENDLKQKILKFITSIRYSKEGYVFVINTKQKVLAHVDKGLINNYLPKKKNHKNITQKIVNFAKEQNGFINYKTNYQKVNNEKVEKFTYLKNFYAWEWIIGSGFYRDKLDMAILKRKKELKYYQHEFLLNLTIIVSIITLILIIITIYSSNKLRKKFIKYRKKIYEEVENNRHKDNLLAQQSKMAAMGEMIGNIAHQWRQPLSLISTSSSGMKLKHELNVLNDEDIIKTADTITNATQHLSKTIDDFRNFFKPNKETTQTSTIKIWEKTSNLIKDQYRTKNIQIITNIEDRNIQLHESELIQVIINILNNARDQFEIKKQKEKYIFINVKEEDSKLYIVIRDNAGGMSQEVIQRIFEPYFTTKHKAQGTGIGLYMSQEIVKKHMKGSIEASNTKFIYRDNSYNGAEFTVCINSY